MAVLDSQLLEVDRLLRESAEDSERRWQELSDMELRQEIAQHRALIASLSQQMIRLGLPVRLEDRPDVDEAAAAPEVASTEAAEFDPCSIDAVDPREWQVPPYCVPIHANVTTYDWSRLARATQFDIIMMDPAWQLATANPTRGVALGYSQLTDRDIQALPIPSLQTNGFLFVWVINAKVQFTMDLFEQWGYTLVDEIVWVKMTVNRRMAKSHGFYLQHAKEVCLVGRKGEDPAGTARSVGSDVLFSERRGQSQKPEEIYELAEALVPSGRYLEIFGRKNNLRNYWVTVGNEVTGQGLPTEDLDAIQAHGRIPGAVYGRSN